MKVDALLLLASKGLGFREAVLLLQTSRDLWTAFSEAQWQLLLASFGLGKPEHYGDWTWRRLACVIVAHQERCGACAAFPVHRQHLPGGFRVLSRMEAMEGPRVSMLPALSVPLDPLGNIIIGAPSLRYLLAPIVEVYANSYHWAERVVLSPEYFAKSVRFAARAAREAHILEEPPIPKRALRAHPLLSSLFPFSTPVASVQVVVAWASPRMTPSLRPYRRLDNASGLTILDIMQNIGPVAAPRKSNPKYRGATWLQSQGVIRHNFECS